MDEESFSTTEDQSSDMSAETDKAEDPDASLSAGETDGDTLAESDETTPSTDEQSPKRKEGGVQKRIDRLVAEREYFRGLAEGRTPDKDAGVEDEGPPLPPEPKDTDYEDYNEYLKALGRHSAQVELLKYHWNQNKENRTKAAQQSAAEYRDWVAEGEDKFSDFGDMAEYVGTRIPNQLGEVIRQSEFSHELVSHFNDHPKQLKELVRLGPVAAVRQIVKLEERFAQPPQKKDTKAPNKTAPVDGRSTPSSKIADMEYEDYKASRERELGWR